MKTIHTLIVIVTTILLILFCQSLARAESIDINRLANAIYYAEGGTKTRHPYGILKHYKKTTPRQACINTIKSALKRFAKQTKEKDFIRFLSLTYCPVGCDNDNGTNQYWVKNVTYFYKKVSYGN